MTDASKKSFSSRLRNGDLIVGTWIKTPHPHIVEVLSLTPLDTLVIDAEHAPFDRSAIDLCILAARAAGMPVLVRPSGNEPAAILQALDGGSDGILVPHIRNRQDAEHAVRVSHYRPNGRGFAGSTRAAGFTTVGMRQHLKNALDVLVIGQIEDKDAVDNIDDIIKTPGLDAIFIGWADLTVSFESDTMDDPAVVNAINRICAACRESGLPFGMFVPRTDDVSHWAEKGASFFCLKSDQSFMISGAQQLVTEVRSQVGSGTSISS